jgi:NADH:ubiquinone oxidoreductase subunit 2 (subunit N)
MNTARARLAGLAALAALLLAAAALAGAYVATDAEELLFSWEASLLPLAALVALSRPGATPAALRTFASCGVGDLALMAGLGLSAHGALPALAFALVCAGALARLAAAPFHGWAIEVAEHAAPPASAFVLAAGKLAGTLLLVRVALPLAPGSGAVLVLAGAGALTLAAGLVLAAAQTSRARLIAHLSGAHSGAVVLAAALGAPPVALAIAGAAAVALALVALGGAREVKPAWPAALARALRGAERALDPAVLGRGLADLAAAALFAVERTVNALHDVVLAGVTRAASVRVRRAHDGSHATYLVWSMLGFAAIVLYLVGGASR